MLDKPNHSVVGDLNAHTPTWGNHFSDWAGNAIERETLELGHMVINTGQPTRIAEGPAQRHTAIDLTIISDDFTYPVAQWETLDDSLGSDHLPCITTLLGDDCRVETNTPPLRFNTKKANWNRYQSLLETTGTL